jgi:hypothetical protein
MKSLIVKLILPVFLVMFAFSTYIPAAEKNPQTGNDPTKSEQVQVQDRKRDRKRDKNCVPKKDGSDKKNKMQKKGNGNKKGNGRGR